MKIYPYRRLVVSLIIWSVLCVKMIAANVSVSGYITDAKNGEIVSGANIVMNESYAVSNNYGYYSLQAEAGKTYRMKVSFVGYETVWKDILLIKDTLVNIGMSEGLELREVVIVSAKEEDRKIESSGLGNLRINQSQLNASPLFLGERDVVKTLQMLPGVSAGMEGSSQLNIRGGTNEQTLFLMDDVPVYSQNHAFGFLSVFNPDVVQNADLYKGGIPAVYGNRLSGVAAISLKDGNYKEHHQSIGFGVLAATVSAEGPIKKDKASYLFAARRSVIDLGWRAAIIGGGSMEWFGFWDINGKLSWKLTPRTKLSASVYHGYDDFFAIDKTTDYQTGIDVKDHSGSAWKNLNTSLKLTSNLRGNMFLSAGIYYSKLDTYDYQKYKAGKDYMNTHSGSILNEVGVRSSVEKKFTNNNTFFFGLDASTQIYDVGIIRNKINGRKDLFDGFRERLFTFSAFAYDELRWKGFTVVPGLRLSYYDNWRKGKLVIEPRVKISTFAGGDNKLMLAYDRMHQPVHSLTERQFFVQSDFWLPYQEDQLPQSDQVSLGWKNYTFPGLTFSLELYYKRMKNLVLIEDREYYLDFHKGCSFGNGASKGMELMLEYNRKRFSGWISYTLSKTTRTFDGRKYPFKYDIPHNASLFLSYVVRKTDVRKSVLSLNAQYHSGIPYSVPEVVYPGAGLAGYENNFAGNDLSSVDYVPGYPNIRLKGYFRTDINFSIEKKLSKGRSRVWQVSLLNATGNKNPYSVYRKNGEYRAFLLIPFLPSFSYRINF